MKNEIKKVIERQLRLNKDDECSEVQITTPCYQTIDITIKKNGNKYDTMIISKRDKNIAIIHLYDFRCIDSVAKVVYMHCGYDVSKVE